VGFVVAGGMSTRMGRDKALRPWGGATLLHHAIARRPAVCSEVRIRCGAAPRYQSRGRPLVLDAAPGRGPLGGLAAGLASAGGQDGLYLGVDLPFVTAEVLAALAAADDAADAIVPVTADGPQPLCALYRAACAPAVARRLAAGDLKMTSFWPDVTVRTIAARDLGAGDRLFHNVNDPRDYDDARGEQQ
jgi:molybdopterin-guanine dinucleotide biosynthesis protein A